MCYVWWGVSELSYGLSAPFAELVQSTCAIVALPSLRASSRYSTSALISCHSVSCLGVTMGSLGLYGNTPFVPRFNRDTSGFGGPRRTIFWTLPNSGAGALSDEQKLHRCRSGFSCVSCFSYLRRRIEKLKLGEGGVALSRPRPRGYWAHLWSGARDCVIATSFQRRWFAPSRLEKASSQEHAPAGSRSQSHRYNSRINTSRNHVDLLMYRRGIEPRLTIIIPKDMELLYCIDPPLGRRKEIEPRNIHTCLFCHWCSGSFEDSSTL
ncbi:hypothetical protein DFH06DRAFT_1145903 [Mycena polygramma]|nr:hypothetical protein DFH06DRAFT_1145903 [Mycena polygramma]